MKLTIHPVKFECTEKLEKYIEKKTKKLEKFFEEIQSVDVYLKVVKPETAHNKEAQIKILFRHAEIFAEKISDTFEQSVDECVDAVMKQIKKHKKKSMPKSKTWLSSFFAEKD